LVNDQKFNQNLLKLTQINQSVEGNLLDYQAEIESESVKRDSLVGLSTQYMEATMRYLARYIVLQDSQDAAEESDKSVVLTANLLQDHSSVKLVDIKLKSMRENLLHIAKTSIETRQAYLSSIENIETLQNASLAQSAVMGLNVAKSSRLSSEFSRVSLLQETADVIGASALAQNQMLNMVAGMGDSLVKTLKDTIRILKQTPELEGMIATNTQRITNSVAEYNKEVTKLNQSITQYPAIQTNQPSTKKLPPSSPKNNIW
jgi:hypothetical protein